MMAPGFSVRFGRPSIRFPIPGITESSTVEWHNAQVMPTLVRVSFPPWETTVPFTPTTALSFKRATVVAGLLRSAVLRIPGGSASASTFSPPGRAVVGSTAWAMASWRRSLSVQNASFPKVSKRKICLPSSAVRAPSPPTRLNREKQAAVHKPRPSHRRRSPLISWDIGLSFAGNGRMPSLDRVARAGLVTVRKGPRPRWTGGLKGTGRRALPGRGAALVVAQQRPHEGADQAALAVAAHGHVRHDAHVALAHHLHELQGGEGLRPQGGHPHA